MFQSFKKMKSADFVYMTILLVFFCVVTVGFFLTTRFIEKNINEIFSNDVTDDTQALNLDNYHFVEKKLSLPVSNLNTTEAEPLSVTTDSPHLDKGMIVISIVNSTNEEGAASSLAQVFTEAGFKTPKIGNSVGFSATTTISMKESKKKLRAGDFSGGHKKISCSRTIRDL